MDLQRSMHLFMNMCLVVFEDDIASSCVYQASWKQIIVAVTLIDVFFRPCFLLRCFFVSPFDTPPPTDPLLERALLFPLQRKKQNSPRLYQFI